MLEMAIEAARAAGDILMANFGRTGEVELKGERELVTATDWEAQRKVLEIIRGRFPEHDVLAEEGVDPLSGYEGRSGYCWVVDPLDGTNNYARGYPFFSVSIALLRDEEPTLGVVYDPQREELFWAEKGQGARLNGKEIIVSAIGDMARALAGTEWPYEALFQRKNIEAMSAIAPRILALRNLGSAALSLCYLAAGRLDIYFHPSLRPWDVAAAGLIIKEAGGEITSFEGGRWDIFSGGCLAANAALHAKVLDAIRRVSSSSLDKRLLM